MARLSPLRIQTKGLFQLLMAIACHASENAYAALSTMLQGQMYIGTEYVVLQELVSHVPVLLTWHSVLQGLKVRVHYVCTPWGEFQRTLSKCQVWLPLVISRVNILCASARGLRPGDAPRGGACFGNQQDFPAQGAILHYMHLGQFYHIPRNTSFPQIASTVS